MKVGSIGNKQQAGGRVMQTENPEKVGDDLSDLAYRAETCNPSFSAVLASAAEQGGSSEGFVHRRPTDAELQDCCYDKFGGIPLHVTSVVCCSLVCDTAGGLSRCYNALVRGEKDVGNGQKVRWSAKQTANQFGKDTCKSAYKTVRVLVEVYPVEIKAPFVIQVDLHLKAMLACIRPSTNGPDSPLSLFADHIFAGKAQASKELQ